VVRELEVPADRVTVCSPGVPDWALHIARERGDAGGSAILFLGTVSPRKNIPGLLEAYARLRRRRPDAPPLVMAGRVSDGSRAELDRVKAGPLLGHVSVAGYVREHDRRKLYRDALMLVLPSFEEGFGLPVLEAMACGVPVVVSNRGSLPEVAGDAAYPVDPDDTDAIAAEMERLLDPEATRVAILKGLAQARRYTWDAAAAAARAAYQLAVAARARRIG
jgi:glycosyltransferase involved in cell wall biosynthesis